MKRKIIKGLLCIGLAAAFITFSGCDLKDKIENLFSKENESSTQQSSDSSLTENNSGNTATHTHEATMVEAKAATCTKDGNVVYYVCNGCEKVFLDKDCSLETTLTAVKIGATGHTFDASVWGYQETDGHAHVCACGEKDTVFAHESSGAATAEKAELCTECGYEIAPMVGHTHVAETDDGDCTTDVKCACGKVMTKGEEAHLFDNACDTTCNRECCEQERTVEKHVDADKDEKCDACGADVSKNGEIELPEDEF